MWLIAGSMGEPSTIYWEMSSHRTECFLTLSQREFAVCSGLIQAVGSGLMVQTHVLIVIALTVYGLGLWSWVSYSHCFRVSGDYTREIIQGYCHIWNLICNCYALMLRFFFFANCMSLSLCDSVSCWLSAEGYFWFFVFLTWPLPQCQWGIKTLSYQDGVTNVEKSLNSCAVYLAIF